MNTFKLLEKLAYRTCEEQEEKFSLFFKRTELLLSEQKHTPQIAALEKHIAIKEQQLSELYKQLNQLL